MKDEIIEIFNKYGKSHYDDKYCLEFETYIIELQELKTLYDCITNLQEENENKDNKILELQQELLNKKLNIKDIEYKEKMIYKSRNEKAIEYIEMVKHFALIDKVNILSISTLENILQGSEENDNN